MLQMIPTAAAKRKVIRFDHFSPILGHLIHFHRSVDGEDSLDPHARICNNESHVKITRAVDMERTPRRRQAVIELATRVAAALPLLLALLLHPAAAEKLDKAQIRRLDRTLVQLFDKKKYEAVIPLAKRLYALNNKAKYLSYAALCHDLLQHDEQALALYRDYLKHNVTARRRKAVEDRIAAIRKRFFAKRREVQILSAPDNARVRIDGKPLQKRTPVVQWMPFGRHTVELELSGYQPYRRVIEVVAGTATLILDNQLQKIPEKGSLSVTTTPSGARVYLDNKLIGTSPLHRTVLEVGRYTLQIKSDGHKTIEQIVTIAPNRHQELQLELKSALPPPVIPPVVQVPKERPMSGYRIAAWVTLGTGIAGLTLGLTFQLLARKSAIDANNMVSETANNIAARDDAWVKRYNGLQSTTQIRQRVAIGMFVVGGASLVSSLVLFLVEPRRKPESSAGRLELLPVLGGRETGLIGRVRF